MKNLNLIIWLHSLSLSTLLDEAIEEGAVRGLKFHAKKLVKEIELYDQSITLNRDYSSLTQDLLERFETMTENYIEEKRQEIEMIDG